MEEVMDGCLRRGCGFAGAGMACSVGGVWAVSGMYVPRCLELVCPDVMGGTCTMLRGSLNWDGDRSRVFS